MPVGVETSLSCQNGQTFWGKEIVSKTEMPFACHADAILSK